MSSHEHVPGNDDSNATQEQTPHSGVHHDETPTREFRDTPLADAPLDYDPRHPEVRDSALTTGHLPREFQVQPEVKTNSRRNRIIAAGTTAVVAVAGIATVAALKLGGSNEVSEPKVEPGVSATPNPGETEPSSTTSPESPVEVDISDLSTQPTPEQIQKALEGVSADVEPLEAMRQFGNILAVHHNSGTVDESTGLESETSVAQGQELLKAFYGPFINDVITEGEETRRLYIAKQFSAAEVLRNEYTMTTKIAPHEETLTKLSDTSYSADADLLFEDNNDNPNTDAIDKDELNGSITITKMGDRWYVSSF